jgi:hypothetical protein
MHIRGVCAIRILLLIPHHTNPIVISSNDNSESLPLIVHGMLSGTSARYQVRPCVKPLFAQRCSPYKCIVLAADMILGLCQITNQGRDIEYDGSSGLASEQELDRRRKALSEDLKVWYSLSWETDARSFTSNRSSSVF